jgi:hypothetical protein
LPVLAGPCEKSFAWEIPFWKAYIQSVVDRIKIDVHITRIIGDKATLEQVIAGSAKGGPGVRTEKITQSYQGVASALALPRGIEPLF